MSGGGAIIACFWRSSDDGLTGLQLVLKKPRARSEKGCHSEISNAVEPNIGCSDRSGTAHLYEELQLNEAVLDSSTVTNECSIQTGFSCLFHACVLLQGPALQHPPGRLQLVKNSRAGALSHQVPCQAFEGELAITTAVSLIVDRR